MNQANKLATRTRRPPSHRGKVCHQKIRERRGVPPRTNLKTNIDALQSVLPASLVEAMHAVRIYGNSGAHEPERLPTRQVLQQVVQRYTLEKSHYERRLR